MKIRTRFAPSPTGSLHIGSVRTALYSWLFARQNKGEFFLRIEDTDISRSTKKSINEIISIMNWLNIDWDYKPFFQTKRLQRYSFFIKKMLLNKSAYKCYCSKERLKKLKKFQIENKIKPRYDKRCRYSENNFIKNNKPYTVRFKNPTNGIVSFNDKVYGLIKFKNEELDDLIIQRENKIPTYNFAVVIDDYDMKITHVIRGSDHINNTPRQINILKSINANIPQYAHLSMILGDDGKKLSKRNKKNNLIHYKKNGFLPEAILNYLVRLGWSYGNKEVFSINEMKNLFNFKSINKSPSIFNFKKFLWLNHIYINNISEKNILNNLKYHLRKNNIIIDKNPKILDVIKITKNRCNTLKDMIFHIKYFYKKNLNIKLNILKKYVTLSSYNNIKKISKKIKNLKKWDFILIKEIIINIIKKYSSNAKETYSLLRIIITGIENTISIINIIYLLGKDTVLYRMEIAIKNILDNIYIK